MVNNIRNKNMKSVLKQVRIKPKELAAKLLQTVLDKGPTKKRGEY